MNKILKIKNLNKRKEYIKRKVKRSVPPEKDFNQTISKSSQRLLIKFFLIQKDF